MSAGCVEMVCSMSVVSAMDLVLSQARVIASEMRWMHVRCVEEMVLAAPAVMACPTAEQCPTCVVYAVDLALLLAPATAPETSSTNAASATAIIQAAPAAMACPTATQCPTCVGPAEDQESLLTSATALAAPSTNAECAEAPESPPASATAPEMCSTPAESAAASARAVPATNLPQAAATAPATVRTRVACVEAMVQVVCKSWTVTVFPTVAKYLMSVACATEMESPRPPAIATETCWTNAGYAPKVLM